MAYKLAKTGVQANVQLREYICDAVDDIATLPDSDPFGSKVFVIETSETYVKSSDGEYVKTTSGGGGGITPHGVINITTNGDHDVTEKATARVNVPIPPGYVIPTGSVEITANGQGIDVAGKATANVNVPQGVFPTGTKEVTITQNGTTTDDVSDYANAEITVNVPAGVTPSEFFPLRKTTVTAGANAVATVGDYIRFVIGLIQADMDIIAISMTERKQSYDTYEVLLCRFYWYDPTFTQTTNYFSLWEERSDHIWAATTNIGNITSPAVILQGTKLDVYYVPHILRIEDRFPEV